ncbi:peptidoglycan DD-metalloendopeptidase family protein [Yimella sp. cx-51]|uniref:peptidoglycan DD-metalloendopeptidase family protein n=1 Tax=Yimella sp. cx-51 TaxID=2770551 RepID=UPI00165EB279|nr:peptidoglycan DD-metalloendopeptidase family protein [Yimella sp. cx-51]MBC9955725.1 peptidoglycan DD-metalloendopeptidase family protein [Yimella sp. cx-51]QTH37710.1 peptidoglycan DD-metalloendopeptidase family protein [Yimella sp. cx-51]
MKKQTRNIALSVSALAVVAGGAVGVGASQSDAAPGKVNTASSPLTVRSGPGTHYSSVGKLAKGTKVDIKCQTRGPAVKGTYGTSTWWNKIDNGRWVSDAYIYTGSDGRVAPLCGDGKPSNPGNATPVKGAFQMPFPCGQVWSSWTRSNHSPRYATDLNRPGDLGDKVITSKPGKVITSHYSTTSGYGHYVVVDHGGGWTTLYAHLQTRSVKVGDRVGWGSKIGTVGGTSVRGALSPHLHFEQKLNGKNQRIRFNGKLVPQDEVQHNMKSRNSC